MMRSFLQHYSMWWGFGSQFPIGPDMANPIEAMPEGNSSLRRIWKATTFCAAEQAVVHRSTLALHRVMFPGRTAV